jgi:dCMP deaminase
MSTVVLLYMPVIHRGYLDFLERHASPERECLLLGKNALASLGSDVEYVLRKDEAIRGLPQECVLEFVRSRGLYRSASLLDPNINQYQSLTSVIAPDEDVTRMAVQLFFPKAETTFDTNRLRYDRRGTQREDPVPAARCCQDFAVRELMGQAVVESGKSKDWWLSVGALISRDGVPLLASYNAAALDPDLVNILGDPRSAFSRGVNTEDTLVAHAERRLVARAARLGLPLDGADAYVTHFPCVPCADDLVQAGIKQLFFKQGYSRLESAELFRTNGVQLIQVV